MSPGIYDGMGLRVEQGYFDRVSYQAVHFNELKLADSLAKAADHLLELEKKAEREPYCLCVSVQCSCEGDESGLEWRVTLVLDHSQQGGDLDS
jgi:hypothetical protein